METTELYGDRLLTFALFFNMLAKSFVPDREKMVENLRKLAEISVNLPKTKLRELISAILQHVEEDVEATSDYFRLFELAVSPPYETSYTTAVKKENMTFHKADVAGFYRAFGVKHSGDYPDHLAAELEFLSLLFLKEAHALEHSDVENAEICREAREKFIQQHLANWVDLFSQAVEKNAKKPTYVLWARLLVEAVKLASQPVNV
ncbi:MAG: molecular chaperone TorD family protein [Candidatus Caldarchaeum sp.]